MRARIEEQQGLSRNVLDWVALLERVDEGDRQGVLGHLLALKVTAAHEQERDQVAELAAKVQEVTAEKVELMYADQGYTGKEPRQEAAECGIQLVVVKLAEAKRGFVLLPKRWVVERSFAWAARFRRLARDYERLPETFAGLHWLAFLILMLTSAFAQCA